MFKGISGKLFGTGPTPEEFAKETLRPLIRRRAEWLLEANGPRPGSWFLGDDLCFTLVTKQPNAIVPAVLSDEQYLQLKAVASYTNPPS
jgi:hypothetical protein